MNSKVSRKDTAIPFIVSIGRVNRGTIRTIHIQTEQVEMQRRTACGRSLNALSWRYVSATEFRGQMMVCERCESAS